MKKSTVIFVVAMILTCCFIGYMFVDNHTKQTTWTTKTVTGHISQLILYNDFPQLETYVLFDNGNYTVIDINHFWAYSHLAQIQPQNNVELTYKVNRHNHKRAIQVKEIEV